VAPLRGAREESLDALAFHTLAIFSIASVHWNDDAGRDAINGRQYRLSPDNDILPHTVGIFKRTSGGYVSAGSGTFARVGNVRGILTCAHVIDAIADEEYVELAIFPVRPAQRLIPLRIKQLCDYIKFGPSGSEAGPDLGFLKLPAADFSNISHPVSSKNLEVGKLQAFAHSEPADRNITLAVGMIAEWIPESATPEFVVRGLVNVGIIEEKIPTQSYDIFRFRPLPDDDFRPPISYKGTSGGGLWRIYPRADGERPDIRLIGVAFFETKGGEIICHGQASIYVALLDAIQKKWPDAVS
jgi:hypothetical protein